MPRAYDRHQLAIDRDPLNQLDLGLAKLPTLTIDSAAIFQAFLNSIKDLTGIDLGSVQALIDSIGDAFAGLIDFLTGLIDVPGFLAVLDDIVGFFTDLADRAGFLTVFQDVVDFFTGLTNRTDFLDMLRDVIAFFLELANPTNFLAVLSELITFLTGLGGTALTALLAFVGWLWNGVSGGFAGFGATVDSILKPLLTWLSWLWTQFGAASETFLKPIFNWLNWLWTQFGAASETFLKPIFTFLNWLWDQFGATVETVLKPILNWLKTANLQSLNNGAINTLWSLLNGGAEGINKTLADVINSVGDFVEGLVPAITGVPGALGIGQITSWAEDVLTKGLTWKDFKTLFGEIPEDILGVLPIANVNLINPELMTQGGFDTATTLAPGTGWAWDGTNTHSGSGGSAKVTGNGTARALYSNQSVSVAAGDKVLISCWVKSTGTVGANAITLSVVEFSGLAQGATTLIGSSGASAGWVQIGVGTTYTVPAGVSTIRVKVAVTAGAATGSSVWFDDISVKKTGLLSGEWMQGVLGTMVQDLQAAIDQLVQGIKGAGIGSGTLVAGAATSIKAALQSIFTTLFGPLNTALPTSLISNPLLATAIPGLSASKITEGDFPSDRIRTRSIVTDKIATDAVTTNEIGLGAVTSTELAIDSVTTEKIATDAVTTNEIGLGAVTSTELGIDSVTTEKIATDAVTANEIKNQTITTALLDPSVVTGITTTVKAAAVGSGLTINRNNSAAAYTTLSGQQRISASPAFYNATGRSSADVTVSTSSGFYAINITNPGWYMIDMGFLLTGQNYHSYNWWFRPLFFKGTDTDNFYKCGTEVININYSTVPPNSKGPSCAQGSWIEYLTAGDTIWPGYLWSNQSSVASASIITSSASQFGTYFSISLLNRSLA